MNTELISLVLSLLGELPMPGTAVCHPVKPPAVYAEWKTPVTYHYRCPDPAAGIDPLGAHAFLVASSNAQDGVQQAMILPVTLYPKNQECERLAYESHHQVFAGMGAAEEFQRRLPKGDGREWALRPATDQEVLDSVLAQRHWRVDHYPGGDADHYPEGVFEIYPQAEKTFDHPLGQGNSALDAVVSALEKAGD